MFTMLSLLAAVTLLISLEGWCHGSGEDSLDWTA